MGLGFLVFSLKNRIKNRTGPVRIELVSCPVRLIFYKNTVIRFGWFFKSKPNWTEPWTPLASPLFPSFLLLVAPLFTLHVNSGEFLYCFSRLDSAGLYQIIFFHTTRHLIFFKTNWGEWYVVWSSYNKTIRA